VSTAAKRKEPGANSIPPLRNCRAFINAWPSPLPAGTPLVQHSSAKRRSSNFWRSLGEDLRRRSDPSLASTGRAPYWSR
jgi:hypothetical protein